ncbi:hypothetical protein QPM17_03685 [Marinobacter sp. TBZ242]|uniref:CopG-like ribbon-helix-helix domain-containing protein n=1 Tax=Marinobacter azerbaijanicus TaxID=3050455 RepID=A0ABT7I7X9_9GAMM|nr:hypothetical protein [Marinobacter sp. TBZ242]MDL0430210.1 hypothetical protein [Marinobacter sp. TBZ242]
MSKYPAHINVKLSADILEEVEQYRAELERYMKQPVNRSVAVRMLIVSGLENEKKKPKG